MFKFFKCKKDYLSESEDPEFKQALREEKKKHSIFCRIFHKDKIEHNARRTMYSRLPYVIPIGRGTH